jgi:hypothetical protein
MLIQHLTSRYHKTNLSVITERCSQFLEESEGEPLLKNLSRDYSHLHKVKARKRNVSGEFATAFNEAFEAYEDDLCQKAIFANGISSFTPSIGEGLEPFYVFPIDGYNFLYSAEVECSSADHKQVFDTMFEQFGVDKGKTLVLEFLKFAYKQTSLKEGIERGSEIILFNIPYYYAVRASMHEYSTLLTLISNNK